MDGIYKKCAYSFLQPMWHDIRKPSQVAKSAVEVMNDDFNGGFPIIQRPISVELNGEQFETEHLAIIRGKFEGDGEEILGYSTDRFQPLQPIDVARCFDVNVNVPLETMAFLLGGSEMFLSWSLPSFEVIKGDEVQLYGIVRSGFTTLKATKLFTATVRPVCWNTITFAENWAKANTDGHGRGEIWKGKGTNKKLLEHLGYWMAHVQANAIRESELLRSFFGQLAKKSINSDGEAKSYIGAAFPYKEDISGYYPSQLIEEKQQTIQDYNMGQGEIRNGIFGLFSGAGTAITPDRWGLLNATSEYFNHYQISRKPIATSVMFGERAKNIMQMVEVLSK